MITTESLAALKLHAQKYFQFVTETTSECVVEIQQSGRLAMYTDDDIVFASIENLYLTEDELLQERNQYNESFFLNTK